MYGAAQTGIGIYIKHLIKNLAAIDKKNEYILFMRHPYFDSFRLPGKNFKKVKTTPRWYSWGEQTKFLLDVARQNCDLVHFPHFSYPIFYPKKFVVTIHDLTPWHFPGVKTSKFRQWAYKKVVVSASRKSEKILTPSFFTKQDLIKKIGVKSSKIKVIPEGVRYKCRVGKFLKNYKKQKEKMFQRLQKKYPQLKHPFIFYTGVWRYHKNIGGLLEAYAVLIQKYNFKGVLVLGGGRKKEDIARIKEKIKKLGLEEQVFLPGFLSEKKLKHFYGAASVFVLPSYYEGFGLVGLEALSQGTPVCCSNVGPLPEVLGDAALYFEPAKPAMVAEKINNILESEVVALKLLQEGKNQLKQFSWLKMAEITLQVYRDILQK